MNFDRTSSQQLSGAMPLAIPVSPRYGTLFVFELKNAAMILDGTNGQNALECRRVTLTESHKLQALMDLCGVYEPGDAARRLSGSRTAYVGEVTGPNGSGRLMVSYGWVSLVAEPLGQSGCAFLPPPSDAWLYDFATDPNHRGRGYYPALLRYILADLSRQNLSRAWIGTEPGNDVSARSIARAGFKKVGDTKFSMSSEDGQPARFEIIPDPEIQPYLVDAGQAAHIAC